MGVKGIYKNKMYGGVGVEITVLTPVFNRKMELKRCMDSVKEQTFRNFEYIIVNDGSTENIDDMINEFMDAVSFPVMYIKKDNGGVHTARNLGIRYARGEMLAMIDSDDELLPNTLETFISIWRSIPNKNMFREVVARCLDQNGNLVGDPFPENINSVSWKIRKKIRRKTKGEKYGFHVTQIMKDNPWPEPDGITFVTEDILWGKLNKSYDSYVINDPLRIYHMETEISYTNENKRVTSQYLKNGVWNHAYKLNHPDLYSYSFISDFRRCAIYCVANRILCMLEKSIEIKIQPYRYKILCLCLKIPAIIAAYIYVKKNKII